MIPEEKEEDDFFGVYAAGARSVGQPPKRAWMNVVVVLQQREHTDIIVERCCVGEREREKETGILILPLARSVIKSKVAWIHYSENI